MTRLEVYLRIPSNNGVALKKVSYKKALSKIFDRFLNTLLKF